MAESKTPTSQIEWEEIKEIVDILSPMSKDDRKQAVAMLTGMQAGKFLATQNESA